MVTLLMIEQVLETVSRSISTVKSVIGIRGQAWPLLAWLGQREFCTGAELKHLTGRRAQEVHRSLHALLKQGLVHKSGHKDEGNVTWWLSETGHRVVQDLNRAAHPLNELIAREFGATLPRFTSELERLRDALQYGRITNKLSSPLSIPPAKLKPPRDL